MINIVNLLSKAFMPNPIKNTTAVSTVSNNPFATSFTSLQSGANRSSYAKNNPVSGGYFAGYYNGKTNIVGRRLFVEV
jgi:hypothetical protein